MIRKFCVAFLLLVLLHFLEKIIFVHLFPSIIQNLFPNLSLVFFCLFAMQYGKLNAQILGFCFGLFQDFFSYSPICFHALIFLIIGFIFGSLYRYTRFGNLQIIPILIAVGTFLHRFLATIIGSIFAISIDGSFFSLIFLTELALNIGISLPLYYLSKFLAKKLGLTASWRRWKYE